MFILLKFVNELMIMRRSPLGTCVTHKQLYTDLVAEL